MNYRFLLVAALLAATGYFVFGRPRGAAPDPVSTEPAVVVTPTPPPYVAPKVAAPPKQARAVSVGSPDAEVYKKYIPYEVRDGVAIAYGDIILGAVPDDAPDQGFHQPDPIRLWDDREIPYGIARTLPDPGRVEDAIKYLQKVSNLTFVPLTDQADGIVFEPGADVCLSALGKTGGRQPIRLANNCGRTEILHELMHALGFVHEHSRPDRDQYVEVIWNNIEDKYRDQFRVVPAVMEDPSRGTPFDFSSIMLYPSTLFGKTRGLVTLQSRDGRPLEPMRDALSPSDIRRLKEVYR